MAGKSQAAGARPLIRYSKKIADEICRRMAEGEAVNKICEEPGMPTPGTVRGWALDDTEGFYARYARARGLQAHHKFERMAEVAEDGSRDYELEDGSGKVITVHENVARSRLIVDTLKWQASKLLPRELGDKSTTELTGPDGVPLIPEGGIVQVFALPDNGREKDGGDSDET